MITEEKLYADSEVIAKRKTTTIYELLGMIKDGKAPQKIKGRLGNIYTYSASETDYVDEEGKLLYYNLMHFRDKCLNDEVEIIEEKKGTKPLSKKDIEALGYACGEIKKCFTNGWIKSLKNKPLEEEKKIPEKLEYYDDSIAWVIDGVGQLRDVDKVIIDTLNGVIDYLKSKGDNE